MGRRPAATSGGSASTATSSAVASASSSASAVAASAPPASTAAGSPSLRAGAAPWKWATNAATPGSFALFRSHTDMVADELGRRGPGERPVNGGGPTWTGPHAP